jgi:signal transduction histidine kinase
MRAIGSSRRNALDYAWVAFVGANIAAMVAWPRWETVPFHLIWTSLTLLYGLRVWRPAPTVAVLVVFGLVSGGLITVDASNGTQDWGELFEVPLMSAMFLAMVWHARRRQDAIRALGQLAEERASLLTSQEQFLHDASHELRTPITIARGHLEQLERSSPEPSSEVAVALDELERMARIVERLLVLAKAERPDFYDSVAEVDVEQLLEEVLMRWAEVAPRVWRLGELATGTLRVDPDALRIALDALVENAVDHTRATDVIEIRSHPRGSEIAIQIADEGSGVPAAVLGEIFDRFARADASRTRGGGGVGLGLAIVEAMAKAYGGRCTATSSEAGSVFTLVLPGFRYADEDRGGLTKSVALAPSPPTEQALTRG